MTAPLADHFAIMIQRLAVMRIPRIVGEADGDDLRNLANHVAELAEAIDAYLRLVGREAARNTIGFEQGLFNAPLSGALEGNALFELNRHADILDQEMIGNNFEIYQEFMRLRVKEVIMQSDAEFFGTAANGEDAAL